MSVVLLAVALQITGTFGFQFLENHDRPRSVWLDEDPLSIWDYHLLRDVDEDEYSLNPLQRFLALKHPMGDSHLPFGRTRPETRFRLPALLRKSDKSLQKDLFPEAPSKQSPTILDRNYLDPKAKDETNKSEGFQVLQPDNDRSADDAVHTRTSIDGNGTSEMTTISEEASSISVEKIPAVQEENIEDLDVERLTSTLTTVVEDATETTVTLEETDLESETTETTAALEEASLESETTETTTTVEETGLESETTESDNISTSEEADISTSTAETLPSGSISARAWDTTAKPPVRESTSKFHSKGIPSTTDIPATDNGTEAVILTIEHVIVMPRIRTAKIIVSSVFLVIGLIAVAVMAVFIFREKRKAPKYDQLNLLP